MCIMKVIITNTKKQRQKNCQTGNPKLSQAAPQTLYMFLPFSRDDKINPKLNPHSIWKDKDHFWLFCDMSKMGKGFRR